VKLVFTKKATNDNATWQQKNPRDKKGQAMREHRLQPGTAARVPIKQVRDVRGHRAAAKVRTPFRQASNSYLETKNLRRSARQRTDEPSTNDRREFVFYPVGNDERHDVRCGHSDQKVLASAPSAGRLALRAG
jgi:hypothetical protein